MSDILLCERCMSVYVYDYNNQECPHCKDRINPIMVLRELLVIIKLWIFIFIAWWLFWG